MTDSDQGEESDCVEDMPGAYVDQIPTSDLG